jgi:hypothetical protein
VYYADLRETDWMNETSAMADVPEDLEQIANLMWDTMHRVAMRIASMPLEQQESAFAITELSVRKMAAEMRIADGEIGDFVINMMGAIRLFVTEIDVGGSPQGGRA